MTCIRTWRRALAGWAPWALLLAGCAGGGRDWASVRELTPAFLSGQAATDASLAADRHGRVALTWVTGDSLGQDVWLALSADSGLTFADPVRLNPRSGSVASSPESRPVAVFGDAGELLIAWSQRREDSASVVDLVAQASADGGRTLGPPVIINDDASDGRPGLHGFPAIAALREGGWFAVWSDPRERRFAGDSLAGTMLFCALSGDGGQTWSDNRPLSDRACVGCRLTAWADSTGMIVVAYRAAMAGRRDPALVVTRDWGLSVALDTVLASDGERRGGCPGDGPALTLGQAGGGHVAWSDGSGGVWIAPWHADGASGVPRRGLADRLAGAGHPRLARLGDVMLVALEGHARGDSARNVIGLRARDGDGVLSPWLLLGADAHHAALAATGDHMALVCWTERGDPGGRVRLVRVTRR